SPTSYMFFRILAGKFYLYHCGIFRTLHCGYAMTSVTSFVYVTRVTTLTILVELRILLISRRNCTLFVQYLCTNDIGRIFLTSFVLITCISMVTTVKFTS